MAVLRGLRGSFRGLRGSFPLALLSSVVLSQTVSIQKPSGLLIADDARSTVMQGIARAAQGPVEVLGDYTCLQKTHRIWTLDGREAQRDSVQLEVGIIKGVEVFGPPGGILAATSPARLLGPGVNTTGDLLMHTRSIVALQMPTITTIAATRKGGTDLLVVSFSQEADSSDLYLTGSGAPVKVGYEGSYAVESTSKELRWLRFRAVRVPETTSIRSYEAKLSYRAKGQPVPEAAETRVLFSSGHTVELRTSWTHCSEFFVSSSIRFGASHQPSAPAGNPVK